MLKNKILGSALIIAGTAIGAGMLAMPLTSAGIGFGMTLVLLLSLWALLLYTGLLFMEVYQTAPTKDAGVPTLVEQYFGLSGRFISTIALLILLYALLSAYITGGGSLITGLLQQIGFTVSSTLGIILFSIIFGSFVAFGMKSVDGLTRVLFSGKALFFVIILAIMLPKASIENLIAIPMDNKLILSAIPIFFTSFGFHVIMASINTYLDADIRRIRLAIIVGTLIPLAVYTLWELATHGVLSQSQLVQIIQEDPTPNGLVKAAYTITGSSILGECVRLFAAFALITSFLGVALGIFESISDLLRRINIAPNQFILTLATFAPPLVFALFYPQGFMAALSYAGLIFAFYGIILPVGLAWKARRAYPSLPYRTIGGNIALIIAFIFGLIIIAIPFAMQIGLLPQLT